MIEAIVPAVLHSSFVHAVDKFGGDCEFIGSTPQGSKFRVILPEKVTVYQVTQAAAAETRE